MKKYPWYVLHSTQYNALTKSFSFHIYLIFTFQQSNRKVFTQGFSIHHTAAIELNKRAASVPFSAYSFGRCHCLWMQGWRDDQAANESDFSLFILCLQCTVWMNFFHPWPSSSGNNESWEVTDRSEYVTRIIGVIYQSAVYKYSTLWRVALLEDRLHEEILTKE